MTLIEPLQSKEVHWSEPLMFIIALQGRFWSFTSPQYYFGLLPYCTNDSEWRFLTAGTGAWWIGFGVPIVTRDRRADPFRTTLSIFTFSFQHKQKKTDLIWIVFRRLLKLLQKVSCLRCGVPCLVWPSWSTLGYRYLSEVVTSQVGHNVIVGYLFSAISFVAINF